MEINSENYEVFIIDYLDGKLDPVTTAELWLFLENNPHLKEDFEALKEVSVSPSPLETFGFKELLIQPSDKDASQLNNENYSHYFIARIEGDLSGKGIKTVAQYLQNHPELQKEYNLFASCRLMPDKKIRYPEPEQLKVSTKRAFIRYYLATGIAASILLLGTIYFRLTPETNESIDRSLRDAVEHQMSVDKSPAVENDKKENVDKPLDKTDKEVPKNDNSTINKKLNIKTAPSTRKEKIELQPIKKIDRKPMIINTTAMMSDGGSRTFYSGLYEDITLSQELALSNIEDREEALANQQSENAERVKGVKAGRIINSVISSGEQIAEQIPQTMNGWLFADIGMKGFNFLTNKNYSIDRRLSSKGGIRELKIEEKNL
ncbi:MAG TPA: hypothetical protein VK172_14550 [Lentimicrobium sp.]|nr:hypothetical protein [Lentimicrobium sp.]